VAVEWKKVWVAYPEKDNVEKSMIRAIVISLSKETENKVVDNETMSYE
jgi:hypothetical protein